MQQPLLQESREVSMELDGEGLRSEIVELLPRLRRFAYSLTSHTEDADDLVQRVVERVLKRGFPEGADLRRWSYRVCKNLWIDEIRFRDVRRRAASDGVLSEPHMIDGEAEMVGWLDVDKITRAMDALPEQQRVTVSLISIEGMSYAEAAHVMDVPVGTVMSRLSRARKELQKRLSHHR